MYVRARLCVLYVCMSACVGVKEAGTKNLEGSEGRDPSRVVVVSASITTISPLPLESRLCRNA